MKNKDLSFKRKIQVIDGIPVEVITTQKFKTITIGLFFERPLESYQNALNALTLRVMVKACSQKDPMALNQRLQELYGAYLQADTFKYGDQQSLQFKLTVVADDHVSEPIFDQGMDLLYSLIQTPVSEFSGFEYLVALEKKQLIADIAARKNDKTAYAFDLLIEGIYKDHPYSLSPSGDAAVIMTLTPEDVRLQIETVFQQVPHKLMVLGDIEPEVVVTALKRQNMKVVGKNRQTKFVKNNRLADQMVTKEENGQLEVMNWRQNDKLTQSKLNMAYGISESLDVKGYYAMMLLCYLLGGGGGSILFDDIREKQSLCYYIHCRMDKFMKTLTVMSGVQVTKIEQVVASVEAHMSRLKNELVETLQLERAKKMLLGSYRGLGDSPSSYLNFIHSQELVDLPVELDVISTMIAAVDCEEIRNAAKKIVPVGIFALIPESAGGLDD